jgi:ABC-type multidrug transport system fused ATPase/permease subunit
VLGREEFFQRRYSAASEAYTTFQAKNNFVGLLPRYVLEVVAMGSMIGAVLYLLSIGNDLVGILPVLALYAFAAYRLLPAAQQIYSSAALIRFTGPSIEILATAVRKLAQSASSEADFPASGGRVDGLRFEREIAFENVYFEFPGASDAAAKGLSFSIRKNSSVGVVGTTGAGKSTALDLVLGLLEPTAGRIVVDGVPLQPENLRAWRKKLGYVPQAIYLSDDTIARNIAFGLDSADIDMDRVLSAARLAQIHDFIAGLPEGYQTGTGERGVRLSGGQRQRIGIARALYQSPELLVFDEATSALDSATEAAIVEEFRLLSGKMTMLIVAHRITTVKDCDLLLLLEGGTVVDRGSYAELLERSARFRQLAAA